MTFIEKINAVLEIAKKDGMPLSPDTLEAQRELNNPHARIALVGCFQVGKTTLLNRAFLGEELLLKQGDGRCTTAVMTKVIYGTQKRLTVVYRDAQKAADVYQGAEVTADLINQLTTVDEPDEQVRQEKRSEIARTIHYIQLEYPCEALRQYTFYDTPGIDDPNEELIELSTMPFLRETDIVILVVDASTSLNQYVKQLLSRSVFQEGLSRVLVMASYRPEYNMPPEVLDQILNTIRAELASMGRGYLPVVGFTFDSEVEGEILHGSSEIQPTILEYIDKNKRAAREERLAWFLCKDLAVASERLKAILLTSDQNEEEKQNLQKIVDSKIEELDFDYNRALDEFRVTYLQLKTWLDTEMQSQLLDEDKPDSVVNQFVAKFDGCESLAEVRDQLDIATHSIKTIIDTVVMQICGEVNKKIAKALTNVSDNVKESIAKVKISTEWSEGEVSTGWGGKINPTLVR
ncbi:MAG: dynamin family protein, partial [Planctomycetia bacterium]|nr:dynamin family protein [Planctomycetia bacterium]